MSTTAECKPSDYSVGLMSKVASLAAKAGFAPANFHALTVRELECLRENMGGTFRLQYTHSNAIIAIHRAILDLAGAAVCRIEDLIASQTRHEWLSDHQRVDEYSIEGTVEVRCNDKWLKVPLLAWHTDHWFDGTSLTFSLWLAFPDGIQRYDFEYVHWEGGVGKNTVTKPDPTWVTAWVAKQATPQPPPQI